MLKELNEDKLFPKLNIIVCCTKSGIIGDAKPKEGSNGLLWHSKEELLNFKRITDGNVVVFGYNTSKFIPLDLIRKTRDVVIIRPGIFMKDIVNRFKGTGKDIFICGGAYTYKHAINAYDIDTLYVSVLKDHVEVQFTENPLFFNYQDYINNKNYSCEIIDSFNDFTLYKFSKINRS